MLNYEPDGIIFSDIDKRVIMIRFNCLKCGKSFTVKEEMAGKKGKCPCGATLTIPTDQIFEKKTDTITLQNGYIASKARTDYQQTEQASGSITDEQKDESLFFKNRPFTQDSVRKNFWSRLIGCSIGVIIVALVICIRDGLGALIFVLIFGAVFTFLMCWKGHKNDIRCLEDKKYYEEQKARFHITKKPQMRIAFVVLLLGICVGLILRWYDTTSGEVITRAVYSFFTTHIMLKAVLLMLNIPIFILIGRLMIGSWKRYWEVTKWHFIPFWMFFPGWWKFLASVRIEDIFLAGAIELLCVAVYVLEYLFIKAVFLR
jgi:DNA-directed RNA polymerase subunit RPC12/RpoP